MLDIELERFIAEDGIGIAEMLCVRPPSVSRGRRTEKMPVSWAIGGSKFAGNYSLSCCNIKSCSSSDDD